MPIISIVSGGWENPQSTLCTCEHHGDNHGYVSPPSKREIMAPEGIQTPCFKGHEEQVK